MEHSLVVTETGLAFLQDARRRGDICGPLDWIPEVYHPLGNGEAVIPDALLHYRTSNNGGSMLRAFVEVDRATMGPERLAAKLTTYARLHSYVPHPHPDAHDRPSASSLRKRTGDAATPSSHNCCSSSTAPAPPAFRPASAP
ncbi:replication-relaxation family protein [Streptomyces sp. NPDC058964]|uniref:replication-relaxation family protein n=1 Tax=Streptomyces sp. NPDC058964 TaxID=3346681 RepID=UPI0036BD0F68